LCFFFGQHGAKFYLSKKETLYEKTNFGVVVVGGTRVLKGVNVNKKHIKHHQEYIQSLMKFHLPRMLDINLAANIN
jgi:hypothetical protein